MKFKRNTHDEDGNLRPGLPTFDFELTGTWPTCCIHMLGNEPQTLERIYKNHVEYDRQWSRDVADCFDYTLADIMEGLAHLIRLGVVAVVDSGD